MGRREQVTSTTTFKRELGPRATRRRILAAALATAWVPCAPLAHGQATGDAAIASFTKAWLDDAKVDLRLRTYYFDNQPPGTTKQAAWAAGGWLAYQSGRWNGLSSQFAYFDSERLWGPIEDDGTKLLRPGQQPIRVVGILNLAYNFDDANQFVGGWLYVDQPNVNRQDNRMVPNTFEGGVFAGSTGDWTYLAGYLTREKTREWDSFRNLAVIAAGTGHSDGMAIGSATWSPIKDTKFQLSGQLVQNVFNGIYVDGYGKFPLAGDWLYGVGAQYMAQASAGDQVLGDYSTWNAGAKFELFQGPWFFEIAYNQNGRGNNFKTPYGSWAGYQSMLINDFDQAGQKSWMVVGTYDFKALGAPGLTLNASYNQARDAIDASTGAPNANLSEVDVTAAYSFASHADKWLQPLSIAVRYANANATDYGTIGHTEQWRIIVNYTIPLH
jgi:hypothetical protein